MNKISFSISIHCLVALFFFNMTSWAGSSIDTFSQGCRTMLTGQQSEAATNLRISIRTWISKVPTWNETGSEFWTPAIRNVCREAENPFWCAGSIEKFLAANPDCFPEGLSDMEFMPIWWISAHAESSARQKEWVQMRLKELKARKLAENPQKSLAARR